MTNVAIFTDDRDGNRYHIGTVRVNDGVDMDDANFEALWEEWRGSFDGDMPDTDSQFVDWLIENKEEFEAPLEQVTYVTVMT